jgi:hypothetical protein
MLICLPWTREAEHIVEETQWHLSIDSTSLVKTTTHLHTQVVISITTADSQLRNAL